MRSTGPRFRALALVPLPLAASLPSEISSSLYADAPAFCSGGVKTVSKEYPDEAKAWACWKTEFVNSAAGGYENDIRLNDVVLVENFVSERKSASRTRAFIGDRLSIKREDQSLQPILITGERRREIGVACIDDQSYLARAGRLGNCCRRRPRGRQSVVARQIDGDHCGVEVAIAIPDS